MTLKVGDVKQTLFSPLQWSLYTSPKRNRQTIKQTYKRAQHELSLLLDHCT